MIAIKSGNPDNKIPGLNQAANDELRRLALLERCNQYRHNLEGRDPQELAKMAAIRIHRDTGSGLSFSGEHLLETYQISWPGFAITDCKGNPANLKTEALWLHYLDRADGFPLAGRWVNLSEIGGLFYQQAFQGYCGDELAEAWGDDLEGLKQSCLDNDGWAVPGLADLAYEWRVLPRLPLCLCYRLPAGTKKAWATILFDASADHYVAADVAAIVGKNLADQLKPKQPG